MLGWMLRNPKRRFLRALALALVLAQALASSLVFGAEEPKTEAAFSASGEIQRAAVSILDELGVPREALRGFGAETDGDVLRGFATLGRGGRTKSFNVMALLSSNDLHNQIRRQLEYDFAVFLFEDDPLDRLDYVSGPVVRSGGMKAESPRGACFLAGGRGVVLTRKTNKSETLFDRFCAKDLIPGLKLERRGMLNSLWAYGGLLGCGAGFMMRLPGLYPASLVLDLSYVYSQKVLVQAGMAIELPLSSIFETSFPLIANARLVVDVKGGLVVDLDSGLGYCSAMGLFYDHAVAPCFSWRIGCERRAEVSSGFSALTDFRGALVWNI